MTETNLHYHLDDTERKALEELNRLRTNPQSFEEPLMLISKALSRIPTKKSTSEELLRLSASIKNQKILKEFTLSNGLCNSAKTIIDAIKAKGIDYLEKISREDLSSFCREYTGGFTTIYKLSHFGTVDNIISALILGENDEISNKNLLFGNTNVIIGLASSVVEEELLTIVLMTDNITEGKSNRTYLPEHYSEFKQAFDLFDISKIGRMDAKEIKKTMIDLGFHNKNPAIFSIIEKLDTPELLRGADFNTFMDCIFKNIHENNKDGLEQIFLLYRDDVAHNTISLRGLKRMAQELGEKEMVKEIEALAKLTKTDIVLNYEEFVSFYFPEGEK